MISGVTMKDVIDRCRGSWALTSDKKPAIVQFGHLPSHVEIRQTMKKHDWDTAWLCWVSTEGDTMSPPMFEYQRSPRTHLERFLNPWELKERQDRCDEKERTRLAETEFEKTRPESHYQCSLSEYGLKNCDRPDVAKQWLKPE